MVLFSASCSEKKTEKSADVQFKQPTSLPELLALPPESLDKVDVARINLLCAEGLRGAENLDVELCIIELDRLAKYVERETKRNLHQFLERKEEFKSSLGYYRMCMLGTVLAEDLKVHYDEYLENLQAARGATSSMSIQDWKTFFWDSRNVFLHGLLTKDRTGTCSSMPFLYVAIAQRLGYPAAIAARKHHLYVTYSDAGDHLNVEATENRGFATPTDEEYRSSDLVMDNMTKEEIDGMGWMKPMDNKQVLNVCLSIRACCLRSAGKYAEEKTTWGYVSRYGNGSELARRVISKNQMLSDALNLEDNLNRLWAEVENLEFPSGGPRAEYFRNRKWMVQYGMMQGDDLAVIQKSVEALKLELRVYRSEISDDLRKVAEAFPVVTFRQINQSKFLAMIRDNVEVRTMRIRQELVPSQYWNGIPDELKQRLNRLTNERDVVEEMQVFAVEEINQGNYPFQPRAPNPMFSQPPPTYGQPQVPSIERGNMMPDETRPYDPLRSRDQGHKRAIEQRRRLLMESTLPMPPLRIEIISATAQTSEPIQTSR
ncbi:MAG: hypothetical protein IPP19_00245 [Verrucomicrobia bacterium]|nr:hypothetical protein [Verrucomicrobiota bacterium]